MGQIKIAIIGAGSSQFSGGIIRDICVTPNLHGIKITLMDIDEKRLRFIGAMGKKLADELHARIDFELTTDREKALDGSSFGIKTAQYQGHPWATELTQMAKRQ